MSHLPLDARAILHHLNELGYRNISAEQLREFLKGMQPQSDKQSAIKSKFATTTTTATAATTRANTQQQQRQQQQQQHQPEQQQQNQPHKYQRSKVKVIKSKRPLCHFKFYLDICDHQLTKRIEADIKALGGSLEFFLNDSITHFITDKEKSSSLPQQQQQQHQQSHPGTPQTPATPTTTTSALHEDGNAPVAPTQLRKGRQTRADAILSRARGIQSTNQSIPSQERRQHQSLEENRQGSYAIWQTEYALRFLQRIQTELRSYIQGGALQTTSTPPTTAGNIQLKRNFIKIESIKRNHRPYYHLLKQQEEWPKIDLCSEDGAFRLTARAEVVDAVQSMTRKSQVGSRTSQRQQDKDKDQQQHKKPLQQQVILPLPATLHGGTKKQLPDQSLKTINRGEVKESSDKQCGVCEICKVEYDILTIHLQSKDHELFAKNAQNFLALDTLIQVSASVESFLEREQQQQLKQKELGQQEEEEEDKDKADELQTDDSDMEVDERLSDSAIAASTEKNNCNKASNNNNNNNSNSNNNNNSNNSSRQQRPSPALREKSKRITKGKHSSEKFQATPPAHSPVNPQTPSPNRKLTTLQDQNQPLKAAGNNVATAQQPTPNTTRRKTMNSVLSPPFRAMLPPSSLYKVVEASDVLATPSRGVRGRGAGGGGGAASAVTVDSPSLIVKFQKVRQSELQRLNGEAENFMFPRSNARSSSELPTDVDRQTTSDIRGHHSIASSASLDTTSEADVSTYPQQQQQQTQLAMPANQQQQQQKRATAVGRRRKGSAQAQAGGGAAGSTSSSVPQQQRFPSAPIQPEMQSQLLRPTRKSSRMATAIVTAATTSSQLQLRRQRGNNKLEDRMGEQSQTTTTTTKKTEQLNRNNLEEDDDDEDEEEEDEETNEDSSCSSGSDEDYIGNLPKCTSKANCVDTREERAARRLLRLTLTLNRGVRGARGVDAVAANKSLNRRSSSGKQHKATPATAAAGHHKRGSMGQSKAPLLVTNDLLFDCSKSERMQKMRYEFEKLPTADLWHRVFQRQDAGEEHYYCYYGTTRYRKLPYEQGPIPMELTKPHSCTLCTQHVQVKKEEPMEQQQQLDQSNSNQMQIYKHKKLQLLQRYQQQQQQQQQQEPTTAPPPGALKSMVPLTSKCDSKASTPELMERDLVPLSERAQIVERVRATSTQSSTSSSCSNSQKSSSRHKQLARLVELPPRKSPREHASTLALVSCIIRQRQDSQSKTNSEAEETPAMPAAVKLPGVKQEAAAPPPPPCPSPAASTRLQTATPVEEMRFATEISETVKRMRRGQNKYDTLPARAPTPVRSRRAAAAAAAAPAPAPAPAPSVSYSRRLQLAKREAAASSNSSSGVILGKRKRRHNAAGGTPLQQQQQQTPGVALLAGVRKLPSKKGLLEYEMEKSALNTLNASMKFVNPMLIAWEIDKYLELTGREYDLNVAEQEEEDTLETAPPCSSVLREEQVQTPPSSTDCCFTSEFDLCDLLAAEAGADSGDDEGAPATTSLRRNTSFNWFAGHQRKRKCLKSNRTGWPRVQRRRGGGVANARLSLVEEAKDSQQQLQQQQGIKQEPLETEEEQTTTTTTTTTATTTATRRTTTSAEKELGKQQQQMEQEEDDDDDAPDADGGKELLDKKQPAAMTPPATDLDEQLGNDEVEIEMDIELEHTDDNEEEAGENDESQLDYDDDETIADLVENQNSEAEIEATDADVEDDDAEDDDEDVDEDDEDDDDDVYEDAYGEATKETPDPLAIEQDEQDEEEDDDDLTASYTKPNVEKPLPARQSTVHSPEKKPFLVNRYCLNVTSTPSTHSRQQQQQQQRRTPQLNGSLESCISPSEKLGDNSDIFTVSSDGLDTDMDLSNTQAGDSLEQQQQTTPKRKFDISKYAPPKNAKAASSCAAEAATAAVKSLAISQFLKKEVRVTCRRLRAPFRRFRYRR